MSRRGGADWLTEGLTGWENRGRGGAAFGTRREEGWMGEIIRRGVQRQTRDSDRECHPAAEKKNAQQGGEGGRSVTYGMVDFVS